MEIKPGEIYEMGRRIVKELGENQTPGAEDNSYTDDYICIDQFRDQFTCSITIALNYTERITVFYSSDFESKLECGTYRPGSWCEYLARLYAKAIAKKKRQEQEDYAIEESRFLPIDDTDFFTPTRKD